MASSRRFAPTARGPASTTRIFPPPPEPRRLHHHPRVTGEDDGMISCVRPGCDGEIEDGWCNVCGSRVAQPEAMVPNVAPEPAVPFVAVEGGPDMGATCAR